MPLMPEGVDETSVLNVINTMIGRNEIMVVPSGENDQLRYITRTAEHQIINRVLAPRKAWNRRLAMDSRTQENTREEFISYRFQRETSSRDYRA